MHHRSGPFYFRFLTYVIISCTALCACSAGQQARDEEGIQKTVKDYTTFLIEANKTRDVSPLQGIADEAVIEKLSLWMAAWEDGNIYLDAEVHTLDVDNIQIAGQSAVVMTIENWSYLYRDLDTQEIAEPRQRVSYRMKYHLEKKEKGWLITEVTILKEEQR